MTKARDIADSELGSLTVDGDVSLPSINGAGFSDFRNKIINGQFNIDQRGDGSTGYTADGYTLDRWQLDEGTGEACTIGQGSFTLGQTDVPGNPENYLEWARGTAGSSLSKVSQRIEGVETLSGETVTRTFWVKASAATELRPMARQVFGTGGSPSSTVTVTGTEVSVTTSWTKVSVSFSLPSVSGKTLGSNDDDYLEISFERDHDDTNATATVDIANVSLVKGDATAEADPGAWRDTATEGFMCKRYFTMLANHDTSTEANGNEMFCNAFYESASQARGMVYLPVEMRAAPSLISPTITNGYKIRVSGFNFAFDSLTAFNLSSKSLRIVAFVAISAGEGGTIWTDLSGAYVALDAEL